MADEKQGRPGDEGHSRPSNEDKPTEEQNEQAEKNDADLAADEAKPKRSRKKKAE